MKNIKKKNEKYKKKMKNIKKIRNQKVMITKKKDIRNYRERKEESYCWSSNNFLFCYFQYLLPQFSKAKI